MKCTACLYPLWNIKTRQCPECGAGFKPSSYEFVLNSVRFGCPHCEQEYYGDGERGHLNPVEFDCVKCGTHIHMDQMVLSPAAGVDEGRTEVEKLPWLERERLRWWKRWIRTIGLALISPKEAMQMTPAESPAGPAIKFFLVTQFMVLLGAFVPMLLLIVVVAAIGTMAGGGPGGGGGGPGGGVMVGVLAGTFAGMLVATMVSTLVLFGVFTLITHGIMAITGPTFGLRRTLHAMAYSSGANVATAAPCIGGYVGWIWWLVSAVIMVKEAHAAKWWRAVLAVLGPVLGTLALFITGYVLLVLGAVGAATTAMTAAQQAQQMSVARGVASAMTATATRDGNWPRHAAQLVMDGQVGVEEFVAEGASLSDSKATTAEQVWIGGQNLSSFAAATMNEQVKAINDAVAAVGDAPAYRVGDLVVCLRAGDPVNLPPLTWVVVVWPDPALNAGEPEQVMTVRVDGSSASIATAQFDEALKAQNDLRAGAGLKPLPHPRDVKSVGAPVEKEPEGP